MRARLVEGPKRMSERCNTLIDLLRSKFREACAPTAAGGWPPGAVARAEKVENYVPIN
jgi:hypothetical protein